MAKRVLGEYEKIQAEGKYGIDLDVPTITFNEIGKLGIRRLDGYEKVSGSAIYTRDL